MRNLSVSDYYSELEKRVFIALQKYSNVHRGAGYCSIVTSALYESAREIALEYFRLNPKEYSVIFGSRKRLESLKEDIKQKNTIHEVFSNEIGLPVGVGALAVSKKHLPSKIPFPRGGGTTKLVSRNFVIWEGSPNRFEPGTPNILGTIAFAIALKMNSAFGEDSIFLKKEAPRSIADMFYNDISGQSFGLDLLRKMYQHRLDRETTAPTFEGMVPFINFDNAATTPAMRLVWDVVREVWRQPERVLNQIVKEVKKIAARYFNSPLKSYEIFFTANTTEGISIVTEMLSRRVKLEKYRPVVVISDLEHNSNDLGWRHIPGVKVLRFPVDNYGLMDLEYLEKLLLDYNYRKIHRSLRVAIVSISGCSNVTGTINNISAVSEIAHRYNARIVVDAAQLAAHRKLDVKETDIDFLVFSGHKMYAPFGSGGLIVKKDVLNPEYISRHLLDDSGFENKAGIAAMGKSMLLLEKIGMDTILRKEKELTRHALNGLSKLKTVQMYGFSDECGKNIDRGPVIAFRLREVHHNLAAKMLSEVGGIGVRNGCFCAHLFVKQLMGINVMRAFSSNISMLIFPKATKNFLPGLIRISFCIFNTLDEVDHFMETLNKITRVPLPMINRVFSRLYYGTPVLSRSCVEESMGDILQKIKECIYVGTPKT